MTDHLYAPVNWSQFFRKSILPTTFLPLTQRVAQFFLHDQAKLPPSWFDFSNTANFITAPKDSASNFGDFEDDIAIYRPAPNHPNFALLEFICHLKTTHQEFPNGVYPKLDHLSPSDALWMQPDHTMRCILPNDIFLLLIGSTKVLSYLKHLSQLPSTTLPPTDSPQLQPFTVNSPSSIHALSPSAPPVFHTTPHLSLRKWFATIHPSESYRVFVYKGQIIAISQKDGLKYDDFTLDRLENITQVITKFHTKTFMPSWSNYTDFVQNHLKSHNIAGNVATDPNNNNTHHHPENQQDRSLLDRETREMTIFYDVYISTKTEAIRVLDISPLYFGENQLAAENSAQMGHIIHKQEHILFSREDIAELALFQEVSAIASAISPLSSAVPPAEDVFMTFLNTTCFNSIPLVIHLISLFKLLSMSNTTTISSLSHPLYHLLAPSPLPVIRPSNCLNLQFHFVPTPTHIPSHILAVYATLQTMFNQSLKDVESPFAQFLATTDLSTLIHIMYPFLPSSPLTPFVDETISTHQVEATPEIPTPPPSALPPLLHGPTPPSPSQSNTQLTHITTLTPLACNHISQLYTPRSSSTPTPNRKNDEMVIALGLHLLFLTFTHTKSLSLNLPHDIMENAMLQHIASVKTNVVELYKGGALILNQDSIAQCEVGAMSPYAPFFPPHSASRAPTSTSDSNTTDTSTELDTTVHYEPHSKTITPIRVFVNYPHNLVVPRNHCGIQLIDASATAFQFDTSVSGNGNKDNDNSDFLTQIDQSELSSSLSEYAIPFRIVTEHTQHSEDQRVTVPQEAARLPYDGPELGIDVSSAEGIDKFVELVKQLQGQDFDDEDDDWSDEDLCE